MNKKATHLKEIAYELGLSVNTISRALRDCYDISDKTKQLVREKAIELGYVPNSVSQFIKHGGKRAVALVINDFTNLYFLYTCDLFSSELKKNKDDFSLLHTSKKTMGIEIIKQCISQRIDAVITLCEPDKEAIELAKLNKIPLVFLGEYREKNVISTIHTDNNYSGIIAANYILNIHRAQKLAYIGIPDFTDSTSRYESFKNSVLKISPETTILYIDGTNDDELDINKFISEGYFNFFCFNDQMAFKFLKKFDEVIPNARKVFPKLHIVGFDALSTKLNGVIEISSIDFDVMKIVRTTINVIHQYLDNGIIDPVEVVVPISLHTRASI